MRTESLLSLKYAEQHIIRQAVDARRHARADYSHFQVGAAVASDIDILAAHTPPKLMASGCNVENAIYEVTHAEQAAIANLALQTLPHEPIRIVVVAVALWAEKEEHHAVPCGFCRQLIREFGNDDTIIYGAKLNTEGQVWQVEIYTMAELLPHSFGPNNLGK